MTMPFFIQTRDSMPIIKASLVEALRMGGLPSRLNYLIRGGFH